MVEVSVREQDVADRSEGASVTYHRAGGFGAAVNDDVVVDKPGGLAAHHAAHSCRLARTAPAKR